MKAVTNFELATQSENSAIQNKAHIRLAHAFLDTGELTLVNISVSRDKTIMSVSRDNAIMSRDKTIMSRDNTIMSRYKAIYLAEKALIT